MSIVSVQRQLNLGMDDWKPIEMPDDLVERVAEWLDSNDGSLGACLICGGTIQTEDDLIPESNQHLCEESILLRYARLFDLPSGVSETSMGYRFGLKGRGWLRLIERLCAKLEPIVPVDFQIKEVKSKFGSLRVVYRSGNDEVERLIERAKLEALSVCEMCGGREKSCVDPEYPGISCRTCRVVTLR